MTVTSPDLSTHSLQISTSFQQETTHKDYWCFMPDLDREPSPDSKPGSLFSLLMPSLRAFALLAECPKSSLSSEIMSFYMKPVANESMSPVSAVLVDLGSNLKSCSNGKAINSPC
ncbi:hypothetical protein NPIL_648571 [Nephila pilipes]|uniref:Uncharacterized protein n=1 Tax=Nephila pilipes TaxID=299642 RepID=A0A8X6N403_NEPPI|nr:hypothetical protein NPIL_648571 [Nephila pilipes]